MKSIRVKNLRSLNDTKEIDIRKINILVGSNSSGKSTFLRIFPLLKQTFNKKINGPILWCGDDDDYVDFGNFDEALNHLAKEKIIKFMFSCNIDMDHDRFRYRTEDKTYKKCFVKVEFSIKNNKETGYDFVSQVRICFEEYDIIICLSDDNLINQLIVNGETISVDEHSDEFRYFRYERPLFDISVFPIGAIANRELRRLLCIKKGDENQDRVFEESISYIHESEILRDRVKKSYDKEIVEFVKNVYTKNDKKLILRWVLLYYLPEYYFGISNYIKHYFRKVYYIAPVRATAERYYGLRNYAVDEVDCRGKNLPVFLNSLSSKDFSQFQDWTKDNLGFEVIKKTSEGHVSLKIKRKGNEKAVNLSDTGFGYSQLLPIVTQLWYIEKKVKEEGELPFRFEGYDVPATIVIEQPELHLHPGLQAKLVNIIAKVAKQGKVNFILETHSETIINRIGECIAYGKIDYHDVGIAIFEKGMEDNNSVVKQGGYDEEGYLENWPIGFFEPEEE